MLQVQHSTGSYKSIWNGVEKKKLTPKVAKIVFSNSGEGIQKQVENYVNRCILNAQGCKGESFRAVTAKAMQPVFVARIMIEIKIEMNQKKKGGKKRERKEKNRKKKQKKSGKNNGPLRDGG